MQARASKTDELERRAHRALDRLETEVAKLESVSRTLREAAGLNGDHPRESERGQDEPPR